MAQFEPATTVYLCTGTGMDMANSIWWHRFAYPDTTAVGAKDATWWNTCFQFFKAHSIANGHWYCTYTDPMRGYFKVGRLPLNNKDIPTGDTSLGNSAKQEEMEIADLPFAETIQAIDYIIFANDGQEGGTSDIKYAFVDKIVSINYNVACVYFTIDAIMTYQKFFHFGKCTVLRDMELDDWKTEDGQLNESVRNNEPEDYVPNSADYIFANCYGSSDTFKDITDFGYYSNMFVLSDVSLQEADIIPNPNFAALPSFIPSESTKIGTLTSGTQLGVGIYHVPARVNNAFKLLGSYNAMEHLLYSYVVPSKIYNGVTVGDEPRFISDTYSEINSKYRGNVVDLKLPLYFTDEHSHDIDAPTEDAYFPMNSKTFNAPYCYFSISDMQGSSLEIQPQLLGLDEGLSAYYVNMWVRLDFEIAPNVASEMSVENYYDLKGSYHSPLTTLWQMPTYAMTPNNSGYNQLLVQSVIQDNASVSQYQAGANKLRFYSGLQNGVKTIGGYAKKLIAPLSFMNPVTGLASAGLGVANDIAAGTLSPEVQYYGGLVGSSSGSMANSIYSRTESEAYQTFGLAKATGGLASGYTTKTAKNAQYVYYFVHLRQEVIKNVDIIFSIFGYAQNRFRFPHINTRKRWCYVQCGDVNIIPQPANNYDMGGVPYFARQQIQARMTAGITFWNVRHALMGDADSGVSTVQAWDDGAIQDNKNCKFIRNYGDTPDCDIMKENRSYIGGYADDYSDDVNQVGDV